MDDDRPLMKVPAVARKLDLHEKAVYRMARNGEIPSVKIGGAVRFIPSEIDTLLMSGRSA